MSVNDTWNTAGDLRGYTDWSRYTSRSGSRGSYKAPKLRFLSSVSNTLWDAFEEQYDDYTTEEGFTKAEKRQIAFREVLRLHYITSMVYSCMINAGIIAITTITVIYKWPTDNDAVNGLIGGLIGLFVGVVVGYIVQRIVHYSVIRYTKLDDKCKEAGLALVV